MDVEGDEDDMVRLGEIAGQLDAAGFDAEEFEARTGSRTTITYGPTGRDAALLLAAQLEAVPQIELDEDITGYRVVLGVGSDFVGVRADALPVEQLPPDLVPPTTVPSTTTPDSTTGSTSVDDPDATTTTTSIPGVVPTNPDLAATCR